MEDRLASSDGEPGAVTAPNIAGLRKMFEEASSLTQTARKESERNNDYFDGVQWTPEELATLKERKQPALPFNRVRPAILGTLGVLEQGASDPKAWPRNPEDEDSADVASKVLRYIADFNTFQDVRIDGAKDYLVSGYCAALVEVDEDLQIVVQPIRWEEFFYDPYSRRRDFKDGRYLGVAKWQYADDVARDYPDAKGSIENSLSLGDDTFRDRPSDGSTTPAWVDKTRRRVMVVELYMLEAGSWMRCCFHAGGVLAYGPSPYLDRRKKPACPIEAHACFVDRENNRYGIVRDMRAPQDEINKRRSKLLHLLTVRQVQAVDPSAVETDAATAKKEAALPDGALPIGWQVVPTTDMAMGQAQLLAEAKGEIERMGPNPAILGRQGESSSGRAQLVRQQSGLTELAVIYRGIEAWELRLYRQMWDRARQYWTAPQFIRVTDDEDSPEFVGINQPPPGGRPMAAGDGSQLRINPQTQEPDPSGKPAFIMPDGQMVLGYQNALAELDVDIILDTTPDTANVQQEQFQILSELAKVYGPREVPFDDLLTLSAIPGKRQLLEKRKARADQATQQQQGQAAPGAPTPEQQQLEKAMAVAKIGETQSRTDLNHAKAEETLFRAQVDADAQHVSSALDLHQAVEPAAGDTGDFGAGPTT